MQLWNRLKSASLAQLIGLALLALIAWLAARLIWALVVPAGPLGAGQIAPPPVPVAQAAALDPFFRQTAPESGGAVTGLAVRLFGTRLDEATGQGSAIIATPDGVQSSFLVGETVMPGVKLAAVMRDGVLLDHNGAREKLFLDQSVPAPVAAPMAAPVTPQPAPVQPQSVAPPTPAPVPAPAPAAPQPDLRT